MSSFGEKLRSEREKRETTIAEIAGAKRIAPGYFEALERNEFEALPGPAFGKLYIRAYADVLGFDPEPWIAEYDRERHRRKREADATRQKRERTETPRARPVEPERRSQRPGPAVGSAAFDGSVAVPTGPGGAATAAAPAAVPQPLEEEPRPIPIRAASLPRRAPDPRPGARRVGLRGAAAIGSAGLLALLVWAGGSTLAPVADVDRAAGGEPAAARAEPALSRAGPAPEVAPRLASPRESGPAAPAAPPARPRSRSVAGASVVRVVGSALGRRVVERAIAEPTDRFRTGEVAVFATRVLDGSPGGSIRHVWIREGVPVQAIRLGLGGSHWRTYSRKTLGAAGAWSVEARDDADRVLARATFRVLPRSAQ